MTTEVGEDIWMLPAGYTGVRGVMLDVMLDVGEDISWRHCWGSCSIPSILIPWVRTFIPMLDPRGIRSMTIPVLLRLPISTGVSPPGQGRRVRARLTSSAAGTLELGELSWTQFSISTSGTPLKRSSWRRREFSLTTRFAAFCTSCEASIPWRFQSRTLDSRSAMRSFLRWRERRWFSRSRRLWRDSWSPSDCEDCCEDGGGEEVVADRDSRVRVDAVIGYDFFLFSIGDRWSWWWGYKTLVWGRVYHSCAFWVT